MMTFSTIQITSSYLTWMLLAINRWSIFHWSNAYDIGCLYPEKMLEPFAARAKIIGFTGVYSGDDNDNDSGLETPVAIHQGQAFSLCDVNCLAHHDSHSLNAITMDRPTIFVPDFGHNSWSRMMCIAQCYSILFEKEGNSEALETIIDTWKLDIKSSVEPIIIDNFLDNYMAIETYVKSLDYDPLVIGRLVVHEINLYFKDDGWNMDGSKRYDPISQTVTSCTANCIPYRDTYGYFPRNHPGLTTVTEQNKYNVTEIDNSIYWQPLMEDNGRGYMSRQEHVAPHIGFHAQYLLGNNSSQQNVKQLPDPQYDYYAESLLVIERLTDSASDKMKWDKISFYDKKFLVRLLLQESMKNQFHDDYTFEDEILFNHGIGAAEYDAVLHAWREKVHHDLVRPTTVIQRWGQDEITTFNGNRKKPAVETIHASDMHAFIRVMPHSEYPSGSSCICTVYQEFVDAFTEQRFEENTRLQDMYWGYGGIDFGCNEMSLLDPSRADFLGCKQGGFSITNMEHLARDCAESRLWGGMHFTASVPAGQELCKGLGNLGLQRINTIRSGSTFGSSYSKKKGRPHCNTTNPPTGPPTLSSHLPCSQTKKNTLDSILYDCQEEKNFTTDFNLQTSSDSPMKSNDDTSEISRGRQTIVAVNIMLLTTFSFIVNWC